MDLSQRLTIVPFTPYEWQYVRQLFKSRRLSDVKECVIILSTWISRTGSDTCVAISCSHVLLHAVYAELMMEGMCESERYMAIDDVRSKHGHAIVRFVNYLNEMGQTTNTLKNMSDTVSKFGIPRKIVNIRHAIAHQSMPTIAELRYATNSCLEWLWTNFWLKDSIAAMNSKNAGTANRNSNSSEFNYHRGREQEYVVALRAFNTWRGKNRSLQTELELSEVPELYAIKQHVLLDATAFLSCLVRDGHLVQTLHQWKNWKIPNAATTSSDDKWEIPGPIQQFWEPVMHMMFSLKLFEELVGAFLWRLREPNIEKTSKDQIIAYTRMLISQFADLDVFASEQWARVLDHLLPVAKHFKRELIDTVMRNCTNLSRRRRNQVHQILEISNQECASPSAPSTSGKPSGRPSGEFHTMDDIQSLMKQRLARRSAGLDTSISSRNEGTGIEMCESAEWMDVPFGMCPGQRAETFTVVVDDSSDNARKRKAFNTEIVLDDD